MIVAEEKFVINASQERVWELVGDAIIGSLQLERMQIMDENNFAGIVKVRMGFIRLPLHLKIQLADVASPSSLIAKVIAKTKPAMLTITEETKIVLTPINDNQTEVVAKASVGEMGPLLRPLLFWKVRSFAQDVLGSIRKYFERAA